VSEGPGGSTEPHHDSLANRGVADRAGLAPAPWRKRSTRSTRPRRAGRRWERECRMAGRRTSIGTPGGESQQRTQRPAKSVVPDEVSSPHRNHGNRRRVDLHVASVTGSPLASSATVATSPPARTTSTSLVASTSGRCAMPNPRPTHGRRRVAPGNFQRERSVPVARGRPEALALPKLRAQSKRRGSEPNASMLTVGVRTRVDSAARWRCRDGRASPGVPT
jgi:hypothetical protein